jgi:hypothetical protein
VIVRGWICDVKARWLWLEGDKALSKRNRETEQIDFQVIAPGSAILFGPFIASEP